MREDKRPHDGQGIEGQELRRGALRIALIPIASVLLLLLPWQSASTYAATYGPYDTYYGTGALANESSGNANTAFGYVALYANSSGQLNTAVGEAALQNGTSGSNNTAVGLQALYDNNADNNTAVGVNAMESNTSGTENTATGFAALKNNGGGSDNTADGFAALGDGSSGSQDTAVGKFALNETSADKNTAVGYGALGLDYGGAENTALGVDAGYHGEDSLYANGYGTANTFLGYNSGPNVASDPLSNATAVGANALVGESNALVLGNNANVGIGTSAPGSKLTVVGTIQTTSGGVKFPDGSVQTTAQPAAGSSGTYLRSNGTSWLVSSIQAADIPTLSAGKITSGVFSVTLIPSLPADQITSGTFDPARIPNLDASKITTGTLSTSVIPDLSASYIKNGTSQQSDASFNIAGSGALGGELTVSGTGISSVAGQLGVGTPTPQSLLQIGGTSASYGQYVQIPVVTKSSSPPSGDCNKTTFVGRMVMQSAGSKTVLWGCSSAGKWEIVL